MRSAAASVVSGLSSSSSVGLLDEVDGVVVVVVDDVVDDVDEVVDDVVVDEVVVVGGLVVVELHPKAPGEPGASMFKALVRRTAEYVELQQANPERRFKVPTKDIKQIYRVLTNAELWGV